MVLHTLYIRVQSLGLYLKKILCTITHADMHGSSLKKVKTTKKERKKNVGKM